MFNVSAVAAASVFCLFSVASAPPTLTFFSEVLIIGKCLSFRILLCVVMCVYLFCGGLIPLFILGHMVCCSRHKSVLGSRC